MFDRLKIGPGSTLACKTIRPAFASTRMARCGATSPGARTQRGRSPHRRGSLPRLRRPSHPNARHRHRRHRLLHGHRAIRRLGCNDGGSVSRVLFPQAHPSCRRCRPGSRTGAFSVFRLDCLRHPLSLPKSARRRSPISLPSFYTRSCSHGGETADSWIAADVEGLVGIHAKIAKLSIYSLSDCRSGRLAYPAGHIMVEAVSA